MKKQKPMGGAEAAKIVFSCLQNQSRVPKDKVKPLLEAILLATGDESHNHTSLLTNKLGIPFSVRKMSVTIGKTQYTVIFEIDRRCISIFLINYKSGNFNCVLLNTLGYVRACVKGPLYGVNKIPSAGKPCDRTFGSKLKSLLCLYQPKMPERLGDAEEQGTNIRPVVLSGSYSYHRPTYTHAVSCKYIPPE